MTWRSQVILRLEEWARPADADDLALLDLCEGPTLDIGCGPGRLATALAERGHVSLGIDVVGEAVGQARGRGASALRRDVFGVLPGEGRWRTALLADGNVGIGGDPVALLRRVRALLDPRGRIVVEVGPEGTGCRTGWAALVCEGERSRTFRWSVVGVDAIGGVAARAGLTLSGTHAHGRRHSAVLEEPR
jgi:SAM-dependent methyltransferase